MKFYVKDFLSKCDQACTPIILKNMENDDALL